MGSSCSVLKLFWNYFDRFLASLGLSWSALGPLLGRPGWFSGLLGRSGRLLGLSWAVLVASWASPGRCWALLGPLLGSSGLFFHLSWAVLDRFWALLGRPERSFCLFRPPERDFDETL